MLNQLSFIQGMGISDCLPFPEVQKHGLSGWEHEVGRFRGVEVQLERSFL